MLDGLRRDRFFWILLVTLLLLTVAGPERVPQYPSLVDWPTLAALAGLLMLTQAVEVSGALARLGHGLAAKMTSERTSALVLVSCAAVLSMVLTNDVALFVIVPLTISLCRLADLPATRLIVFEALAVNAGSALTPIGNPQNLFLWQRSGVSFGEFMLQMLPLVIVLLLGLLALTAWTFRGAPMRLAPAAVPVVSLDRPLLWLALALYLPFLVLADRGLAGWGCGLVFLALLSLRARVLTRVDWGLLLVFLLMFVDLRLVADLGWVRQGMAAWGLSDPVNLYWAAIGTSQLVSNVPSAIALAEYSADWRVLAFGVNIGGFGWMVGSLANLIALRLAGDRRAWLTFHAYAVPFLLGAAAVGYGLI